MAGGLEEVLRVLESQGKLAYVHKQYGTHELAFDLN